MNRLPVKGTLTQVSGVSFCMARGIVNISGSSFNNFFFTYNFGGVCSKIYIALKFDLFNQSLRNFV